VSLNSSIRAGRARATGSRVVSATIGELPALFERAVAGSRHFTVDKTDATSVQLYRRTNWLTWGETLIADFSPVDTTQTLVTVSSRPTFRLQVQDWGQSEKDVGALLDAVAAVASGTDSPLAGADGTPRSSSSKLRRQVPVGIALLAAAASIVVGILLLNQH
jgi:hypothetical protein